MSIIAFRNCPPRPFVSDLGPTTSNVFDVLFGLEDSIKTPTHQLTRLGSAAKADERTPPPYLDPSWILVSSLDLDTQPCDYSHRGSSAPPSPRQSYLATHSRQTALGLGYT